MTHLFILLSAFLLLLSGCQSHLHETEPRSPGPETSLVSGNTFTQPNLKQETKAGETILETEFIEPLPEPYIGVHTYQIDAAAHPELDFTYHDEYQNYAICDYAITPKWIHSPDSGKEISIQTKVKINDQGITEITPGTESIYRLIRTYGGESYVLQRLENGIRVVPLSVLCAEEEWTSAHWFSTVYE